MPMIRDIFRAEGCMLHSVVKN